MGDNASTFKTYNLCYYGPTKQQARCAVALGVIHSLCQKGRLNPTEVNIQDFLQVFQGSGIAKTEFFPSCDGGDKVVKKTSARGGILLWLTIHWRRSMIRVLACLFHLEKV